jgi:hypothetical protein
MGDNGQYNLLIFYYITLVPKQLMEFLGLLNMLTNSEEALRARSKFITQDSSPPEADKIVDVGYSSAPWIT